MKLGLVMIYVATAISWALGESPSPEDSSKVFLLVIVAYLTGWLEGMED